MQLVPEAVHLHTTMFANLLSGLLSALVAYLVDSPCSPVSRAWAGERGGKEGVAMDKLHLERGIDPLIIWLIDMHVI